MKVARKFTVVVGIVAATLIAFTLLIVSSSRAYGAHDGLAKVGANTFFPECQAR